MSSHNVAQETFYVRLIYLLQRSQQHYQLYLKKNKTYLFAKSIYRTNQEIVRLINRNIQCVDNEERKEFLTLVIHYDIWLSQFEILEQNISPSEKSVFVFSRPENTPAFPKAFCDSLVRKINHGNE